MNYRLTLITICSLCFVGCSNNKTKTNFNTYPLHPDATVYGKPILQDYIYTKLDIEGEKELIVEMSHTPTDINPLKVCISVFNPLNRTVYIPFDAFPAGTHQYDGNINYDAFKVIEDGNNLTYIGFLIDTNFSGAIALTPNETYHSYVNLDENYNVHKGTHTYNITYPRANNSLEFDATLIKDGIPEQ